MPLRGRPPKDREDWMVPVAELQVQEHMSFSSACQALGVKFDNSTAERAAEHCDAYREVLWALGLKYYAVVGDNPLLTKGYLAGVLADGIKRLMEQDQPDKIAIPGKLLADLMGWLEQKPDVPVIANLTNDDLEKLRAEVKAKAEEEAKRASTPVQVVIVDGGKPN